MVKIPGTLPLLTYHFLNEIYGVAHLALKLICFFHGVLQTQRNMSVLLRFGH